KADVGRAGAADVVLAGAPKLSANARSPGLAVTTGDGVWVRPELVSCKPLAEEFRTGADASGSLASALDWPCCSAAWAAFLTCSEISFGLPSRSLPLTTRLKASMALWLPMGRLLSARAA